ncbi:hypothetical protein G6F55_013573 [Rhizopus delemar]|nr:hypothetical protein G6F55_013573 [Rhizopus delemar]
MAQAGAWPAKPVKLVVPFPAGGCTDSVGRLLAAELSKEFGQSVIVENKGGANGNNGSCVVDKAEPDGYPVLLSGVGRVAVGLLAVILLLAPFGEGPADLLQRFDQLRKGLAIGEAQIRPGAVLQALLVLGLSLLSVKMLKRWLANRYLPTTELDPGMQLSAATLFGYAGCVLAVALSLSAAGIGLERVAWIAKLRVGPDPAGGTPGQGG